MLNQFRSGHDCSADQMYRSNFSESLYCDCVQGVEQTMDYIILNECAIRNGGLQSDDLIDRFFDVVGSISFDDSVFRVLLAATAVTGFDFQTFVCK